VLNQQREAEAFAHAHAHARVVRVFVQFCFSSSATLEKINCSNRLSLGEKYTGKEICNKNKIHISNRVKIKNRKTPNETAQVQCKDILLGNSSASE